MFSVALFLLQKTEKRSASRKLVKYWHTNEKKKVPNSLSVKTVLKWGEKNVYGSENADYKIMHYNYIKHVFKQKSSKRSKKKLNFYTKELKQ